jgi:uncharacterized protein YbaP (TraB family)
MKHFRLLFFAPILFVVSFLNAQKKYPSLFWEITGNGLKKPSYLFGTMHVSSKMVFNLSDSFYRAMRNADAVALELNPELWQDQMFKVQKAQTNLARFAAPAMNDYLKERSFQLQKYEDDIKRALTEEPTVVNNLLYRSYQTTADFEENTYLDLYIYQTGRKLGKQPTGVEDYIQSEKLMMEAYQDMAKEKGKKTIDTDDQSPYQIQRGIQEAYRKGDLDLMDSLEALTNTSPAFTEKFLYVRNEIQANSIDTIIQKHSLFVGVGAAHLPGQRGVIELLRKKGYHLRPIFMQERNASQKDEIDKMRVPVNFQTVTTDDGLITLQIPGKLYKREESRGNESWQYADMNNGSYYMLTRVPTHAPMLGQTTKDIVAKVDSMLYENIPGKIIKKTAITKNGFPGFDITNRTRRGDLQRYEIIVSPFEVLVFKMSGNDGYVDGKEAETFFSSIQIKNPTTQTAWIQYQPNYGGFTVKLPQQPHEALDTKTTDRINRMEYEAVDSKTGNAYVIWRKSVYNLNFLEEDTFDLALIEESFQKSELINKRLSRQMGVENNVPFLETKYSLKDGGFITAKTYIKGPHYFLLAARSKDSKSDVSPFFNSFRFTKYHYPSPGNYIDSSLSIGVLTSVRPDIDTSLRQWMEKANNDAQAALGFSNSMPKTKNGVFRNDSTGESILVSVNNYPKYYYSKDTSKFWKDALEERNRKDMVFSKKEFFRLNDTTVGYNVVLTDTNTSRRILATYILKDNSLFKFATVTDTSSEQSDFIKQFFTTARPIDKNLGTSVFKNKLDVFFADYASKDSVVMKEARQSVSSMYYGKDGIDKIVDAINNIKYGDKDYFDIKSRFITELGYIDDTASSERLVGILKNLYKKTADTTYFQNAILTALARLQTKSSFTLLKELLVQDPPVFENSYEYSRLFNQFTDTLSLAKNLFPEMLQLALIEDYKPYVNSLLKSMVDSGYLKGKDYESYYSKLYYDAKIELKKQQNKDEKKLQQDRQDDNNDAGNFTFTMRGIFGGNRGNNNNSTVSPLADYAVLLMPFYDKYPTVQNFFEKLLQSKDVNIQLAAAKVLLLNNKKLPDTLLASIAGQDKYRAKLFAMLEKINRKDLFPAKYKTQEDIARSLLLNDKSYKEFADLQLVNKEYMQVKGDKGTVYLFKYKINKDDDWKIGISGLQPINTKEVNSNEKLVKLTDRKLKAGEPVNEQFQQQIKRLLFAQHKSARQFFEGGSLNLFSEMFED